MIHEYKTTVCDICGKNNDIATTRVTPVIEIDLCRLCYQEYVKFISVYVAKGRYVPPPTPVTALDIRTWAREEGLRCPPTGPLPQNLVDAYHGAHPQVLGVM